MPVSQDVPQQIPSSREKASMQEPSVGQIFGANLWG